MSARAELTPQMLDYEQKFADSGEVRWVPYLMYFHPADHRSETVNTDSLGFRYSESDGTRYSVADRGEDVSPVRLLAGSSTVFGIGASADRWTLSSRMSQHDTRGQPWINFGGRSFNSTQELMLLTLYRHLLPKVEEIILFSGFNNLGLARLPQAGHLGNGAFFNCNRFFDALGRDEPAGVRPALQRVLRGRGEDSAAQRPPSLDEQIETAADLTLRHLDVWRLLAADMGAKLTYILQPLAGWVRDRGSAEEEALFAELDRLGRFTEQYGDILQPWVGRDYAARLAEGAKHMDVDFIDFGAVLADSIGPDQWLFVDRIHFTDNGHDFVAQQILENV